LGERRRFPLGGNGALSVTHGDVPYSRVLKSPLSLRLLKKVQIQGGK